MVKLLFRVRVRLVLVVRVRLMVMIRVRVMVELVLVLGLRNRTPGFAIETTRVPFCSYDTPTDSH